MEGEVGGFGDFVQYPRVFYPLPQGLEPAGSVPLQAGRLFLGRPFFRHKGTLPFQVGVTLDVLRDIEVGKPSDAGIKVGHLRPQVASGCRRDHSGFPLVPVRQRQHLFRPRFGQGEAGEGVRQLGRQFFLADVWLGTGAAFPGTAVIDVAVDIAVLLSLHDHLGRDETAACPAPQEAAQRLAVGVGFLPVPAEFDDFLYPVPKPLGDDGRVASVIYLSGVLEVAIVKGIGEGTLHAVFRNRPTVLRADAILMEKLRYILVAGIVLGIQLKSTANDGGFALVRHHGLRCRIVQISHGSGARIVAAPRFFTEAAQGVIAQVAAILVRHAELDGHEKHAVLRVVAALRRLDVLDHALLEPPTHLPAVHRIAGEAVELPADDAPRLAASYAGHHIGEDRAAGRLGGLLLDEFRRYFKIFPTREFAQFGKLRLNREHLLVLGVGGFADIEEVVSGHVSSIAQNDKTGQFQERSSRSPPGDKTGQCLI